MPSLTIIIHWALVMGCTQPIYVYIYIYISMQFSQHVLEGTFAEGLNVCVFDCGHLGPLSHRGHDPIDRLVEK